MKYLSCILFGVFFITTVSYGGHSPEVLVYSHGLVFQSPKNGDTDVPQKTTLIVRPQASVVRSHTAQDFSFSVRGELSGVHSGKVVISDDNRTVIFKPDLPFVLNENVNVGFSISDEKTFDPVIYSFRITPMTVKRQVFLLKQFRDEETREIEEFRNKVEKDKSPEVAQTTLSDTIPPYFPKLKIDIADLPNIAPGEIFLAPGGANRFIMILDNDATPLFEREILPNGGQDFKMESNNRVSYFNLDTVIGPDAFEGSVHLLNKNYAPLDTFRCGNGYFEDYHDFRLLPNGHVLLEAYEPTDNIDMRVLTGDPNASKSATLLRAIIQELDTNKNVIFQWRSRDHFSDTDATHIKFNDPNHTAFDCAHINSMELDTDGNIIASFRHMDEVTKINSTNGRIIWRWGGKNNFFTFTGDTLQFSYQHDARRLPNGHITLWDNGNYRKTQWGDGTYHDTSYSRAVEYDLDESSLTAKVVWEYLDLPFCFASGNVQRLPNGNTFIGFGVLSSPNVLEITQDGKKVFQLSLIQGGFNYRSLRYVWSQPLGVVQTPGATNSLEIQSIYPNPARNSSTVTFSTLEAEVARVELIDVLGKVVRSSLITVSGNGTDKFNLDTQNIPNGTYYCKLSESGKSATKLVVIQK